MGAVQIATLVLAVAKAIPIVNGWVVALVAAVNKENIEDSRQSRATRNQELKALNRALQRAENDEDIKALSITRSRLKRGWLS